MLISQHIMGPVVAGYDLPRVRRQRRELPDHARGVLVSLGVPLDPLQVHSFSGQVLQPDLDVPLERVVE